MINFTLGNSLEETRATFLTPKEMRHGDLPTDSPLRYMLNWKLLEQMIETRQLNLPNVRCAEDLLQLAWCLEAPEPEPEKKRAKGGEKEATTTKKPVVAANMLDIPVPLALAEKNAE